MNVSATLQQDPRAAVGVMHVTIYASRHCAGCRALSERLVHWANEIGAVLDVREISTHIEEAARLRIIRPPAVVINGKLFGQGAGVLDKLQCQPMS